MALSRSRVWRWLPPLLLVAILAAAHPLWLGALGSALILAQQPFPAEMVVVLAGGYRGNRVLKAADLVRQGFAPRILVSGPEGFYGLHESDLAIPFAVKRGCPPEWFVPLPTGARSTEEEARDIVAELRRRGVRRFLLVTSDYHTRRAHRVYRRAAPELEFRTVAAADPDFPGRWWHSRQGRKTVFFEWSKTVAWWLGL